MKLSSVAMAVGSGASPAGAVSLIGSGPLRGVLTELGRHYTCYDLKSAGVQRRVVRKRRCRKRIFCMIGSLHFGSAVTAAFLASLVEAVEALTVVLAVATVRGWRPAGLGAIAGLALLAVIVAVLGPLLDRVPLHLLQLAVGILLLLFGMRWLRKAILRAAGIIPLHDETRAFAAETAELREQARVTARRHDWFAGLASFKAVLLEGLEVVF